MDEEDEGRRREKEKRREEKRRDEMRCCDGAPDLNDKLPAANTIDKCSQCRRDTNSACVSSSSTTSASSSSSSSSACSVALFEASFSLLFRSFSHCRAFLRRWPMTARQALAQALNRGTGEELHHHHHHHHPPPANFH